MFPSTSPRKAFLTCPPSPPWNLPSFTVESTLSSPCSSSDLPLSRQGAALAHLDSLPPHDLVLYIDGSVPFPFGNAATAYLPTVLSMVPRPLSPFQQTQYAQVFLLNPAPFCMLFAGIDNANNSAISLLFSSYVTLVLSSPSCPLRQPSFYLKLYGRFGRNCLLSPPVLSGYNGSPDTCFWQGTTRLMS